MEEESSTAVENTDIQQSLIDNTLSKVSSSKPDIIVNTTSLITTTATDAAGNTSEFSAYIEAR